MPSVNLSCTKICVRLSTTLHRLNTVLLCVNLQKVNQVNMSCCLNEVKILHLVYQKVITVFSHAYSCMFYCGTLKTCKKRVLHCFERNSVFNIKQACLAGMFTHLYSVYFRLDSNIMLCRNLPVNFT